MGVRTKLSMCYYFFPRGSEIKRTPFCFFIFSYNDDCLYSFFLSPLTTWRFPYPNEKYVNLPEGSQEEDNKADQRQKNDYRSQLS